MIRIVVLLSVLAGPLLAGSLAAQTTPNASSGGLILAPASDGAVLQAPASGPLITGPSAPSVLLTRPEEASVLAPQRLAPAARPDTRPVPRPDTLAEVAEPTAQIAATFETDPAMAARAEAILDQGPLPETHAETDAETLAVPLQAPPQAPLQATVPTTPTATLPVPETAETPTVAVVLTTAFSPTARRDAPLWAAAVLLPTPTPESARAARPVAVLMPPLETAPILPRLSPSGPAAQDGVAPLRPVQAARLSAALLPSLATTPTPGPVPVRAPPPGRDPFPRSALPPSALPEGPESMAAVIQPPGPLPQSNAAVLLGQPSVVPVRAPVPVRSIAPLSGRAPLDPNAPIRLPEPDARALARMMDDAMICWRMADLDMEAAWARLSVDVALDETNRPSAASIRLTGFAHTISGAAESAYRAAHAALTGCAEATDQAPATASATLIFDRSGVRLQ